MVRTIELVVTGVDTDDDDTDELLSVHLSDLGWFVRDGITTATVYLDEGADAVAAACDAANRIEHLTGGKAVRVHEDPVGVSDIALRTGLHRETVRLLTRGQRGPGGFPDHRGTTGSGSNSARIWHWADVLPWLHEHYKLCLDEQPLTARETTQVNAHLERVTHDFDTAWKRSDTHRWLPLHADVTWAATPTAVAAGAAGWRRNASMPPRPERVRPVAASAGFVTLLPA